MANRFPVGDAVAGLAAFVAVVGVDLPPMIRSIALVVIIWALAIVLHWLFLDTFAN
ncbi:hypothetical protein [Microbispora sp. NPDC049125]|uniref:hypothetical protein n=1 Tax=Microbispora sp. NPDC049125 TaxID=3154929 RepID=UPI003465B5EE